MKIVVHRRNKRSELDSTDRKFGVEVDLRSSSGRLITAHDPFSPGEDFESWLTGFCHSTLIINVKEDGLEDRIILTLEARGIRDFFLLDQSFPSIVRSAQSGETRSAVRVSEFESLETALALAGRVRWVWIDSFKRFPLSEEGTARIVDAGFMTCVVSPELQGRNPIHEVPQLLDMFDEWKVDIDAVCTKRPDLWQREE